MVEQFHQEFVSIEFGTLLSLEQVVDMVTNMKTRYLHACSIALSVYLYIELCRFIYATLNILGICKY